MVLSLGIFLLKNIPTKEEITESLPNFEIVDGVMSIEEKQKYFDEVSYNPHSFFSWINYFKHI